MSADVTTVICARNAAGTIARSINSAVAGGGPVVLVDDWSQDDTINIARAVADDRISVVRPAEHRTLGLARQTGVAAVRTEWMMWLDADDALLPHRSQSLMHAAKLSSWDAVWDAVELWDGPTERFVRTLPMPEFMLQPGAAVRLFERNHTPGPAWPLVRTEFARRIGYDVLLPTADDLDFMLRGLRAGGRFGFVGSVGYRQYGYPTSLSRDLRHQRAFVAQALRKHDFESVKQMYLESDFRPRVAAWGTVSMALFREEPEAALRFLDVASPAEADPNEILETDGPWPFREGWRRAFTRGTCLALIGGRDDEAAEELRRANGFEPTAEGANNLGVALARLGRLEEARVNFAAALRLFPGYLDARLNAADPAPSRITTHPLRRLASRSEY
jgi:glycosyltransferase involved in cell wall biosynthesis